MSHPPARTPFMPSRSCRTTTIGGALAISIDGRSPGTDCWGGALFGTSLRKSELLQ